MANEKALDRVIEFQKAAGTFYLATVEGDAPRLRPMGILAALGGKLCFVTNNQKDMYKQLISNPNVELAATDPDRKILRVRGPVSPNTTLETKRAVFQAFPFLGSIYKEDDGIFEVIAFDHATAVFYTMSGDKETIELY
jgi:uncharacterized pyridoxamine 5'-phosphate oxidase family protein